MVYCHYHYSTKFAQRCNGCNTAILKQFVEIFRNGQDQHWHPECYMIHKFWNVRLAKTHRDGSEERALPEDATDEERGAMRSEEEQMEERQFRIWSVLSQFEETSAACISDMLLHVSNGAYMEGVLVAKKFITYVDVLFSATDRLDSYVVKSGKSGEYQFFGSVLNTDNNRSILRKRGEATVQAHRVLLHAFDQDPRHRSKTLGCHTRIIVSCHWTGALPQTPHPY